MESAFEKIKERLETEIKLAYEDRKRCLNGSLVKFAKAEGYGNALAVAIEIVNQVAEEFATDINVGNSWKIIYDKVLELEKEYAMSGAIENVNDCIRLENLLQYFKEELREENNQSLTNNNQSLTNSNQSLTNADKIRSMSNEELAEFLPIVSNCMCQPTDECLKIICNKGECSKTKECALHWLQSEVEE